MKEKREFKITEENVGGRIDKFLADKNQDLSRSYLQDLIKDAKVEVNGKQVKKSYQLSQNDKIKLIIPEPKEPKLEAEEIPLDVLSEDKHLLVINKQPNLVVHPAPGHQSGTLVNGLLNYCDNLSGINGVQRPGIVHRLDQDTSGTLVVAKNNQAHRELARQFKQREVKKVYLTLVHGNLKHQKCKIDAAIGRDPQHRKKMAVTSKNSKRAVSRCEVVDRYGDYSLVQVKLVTGRTHQIRVHLDYINHPVVGDQLYGRQESKLAVKRQLLHARRLGFYHPQTGDWQEIEAPLLADMKEILSVVEEV